METIMTTPSLTAAASPELAAEATPQTPPREQVFFVVRHKVKPRHTADYESWLRRIMKLASDYPGHLGVQVVRPHGAHQEYTVAVRFASHEDAQGWHGSDTRRRMVDELAPMLARHEAVEFVSGIDFWFTPAAAAAAPRWKQWLVTTSVIWPLTLLVPLLLVPLFQLSPLPLGRVLEHGVSAGIMVALVVFVIMPRYTRLLARWLYRQPT